jgi:hypothetical protein
MVKVKVGIELLDKDTGDQGLKDLADDANRKKGNGWTDGSITTFEVFQNLMKVDVGQYVVSKGGDVVDFKLCIEIGSGEDLVPSDLIGAKYTTEEGVEVVRTWNEWLKPNCIIVDIDGRKFLNTASCIDYSGYLPMSELVPVFSQLIKPSDMPRLESE